MMKKLLKKLYRYYAFRAKTGISYSEFNKLSSYKQHAYIEGNTSLFGKSIYFSSPFWYLHSLEEIFIEEVYRFIPSNNQNVIIDCGANIGLSAIYLKKMFPNSTIIAIEPDTKVFEQLTHNINEFGYTDSVKLINAAAWIANENLSFISEGSVGGKLATDLQNHPQLITVKAIKLLDLIKEYNTIFFLKIDIEGAEYEVIKDIREELKKIENIFIEFHIKKGEENKLDEILSWVKAAGFTYYIKEAWNNMSCPFTKKMNDPDGYQMQLNIFCFKND